ncbi:MAG TPA: hypothetical protein VF930_05815 [Stellaceae bacterium]
MPQPIASGELEAKINAGCAVRWPDAPELDGLYALDEGALALLALYAAMPPKERTLGWPRIGALGCHVTIAQLVRLGGALAGYRASLTLAGAVRQAGADLPWPAQPVTIA